MKYNLQCFLAYLLREGMQRLWANQSPAWANRFLNQWCTRTMRSNIEPMKKVAKTIRRRHNLQHNWFRAKGDISAGVVEGFNNKPKLTTRKAYGFRTSRAAEVALYHALAKLPEPNFTHEFVLAVSILKDSRQLRRFRLRWHIVT